MDLKQSEYIFYLGSFNDIQVAYYQRLRVNSLKGFLTFSCSLFRLAIEGCNPLLGRDVPDAILKLLIMSGLNRTPEKVLTGCHCFFSNNLTLESLYDNTTNNGNLSEMSSNRSSHM